MNWLSKRCIAISSVLFALPILVYPVRGSIGQNITTYTYGFPFPWFSVHFTARGGRLFLWQALSSPFQSFHIDFITAILNFIILYVAVRAIFIVFGQKKQAYHEKKSKKEENKLE
ncbi:MAG: hypothetical protein PUC32_03870 [Oscillospiraceae bacterium]|nr:hypothetical protein [Oscillospiraceae bacterium]